MYKWTLGQMGKTNPNEPKRTQNEPKTNPISEEKMLLRMTINNRANPLGYHAGQINAPKADNRLAHKFPGRFNDSESPGPEKLDRLTAKEYQIDKNLGPIQQNRKDFVNFTYNNLNLPGCSSAWPERLLWEQEVAGSNPVTPIFTVRIEFLTPNTLQYPNSLFSCLISLKMPNFGFPRLICILLHEKSAILYITHMSRRTYNAFNSTNLPFPNLIFIETLGIKFQDFRRLFRTNIRKTSNYSSQIREKNRTLTKLSSQLTNNICDVHSYTNHVTKMTLNALISPKIACLPIEIKGYFWYNLILESPLEFGGIILKNFIFR
jgi:hypothetical protein